MDLGLRDARVLVTGGASNIGRGIVHGFAAEGCRVLIADVDGQLTVAVVPVAGSLDLKALAAAVGGKKAAMADPAQAEKASGYVTGGIAPVGLRRRLPVVLDETALGHATVFCSAGQRGLQIELAPADLVAAARARTAAIGRP